MSAEFERDCPPGTPWVDPDQPDPVLDAAYQNGIVPRDRRWVSDFTYDPKKQWSPDAV